MIGWVNAVGNKRVQLFEFGRLSIYYAYSLSGFLVIIFCPTSWLEPFLTFFPLSNLVFSLIAALFYTSFRSRLVDCTILLAVGMAVITYTISGHPAPLISAFVLAAIVCDFSLSQAFSVRWVSAARLFLLSVTVLVFYDFEAFLYVRIALTTTMMAAATLVKDYKSVEGGLPESTKVVRVILINALYFGPLIVIGVLVEHHTRHAYLLYAVIANVAVRFIDFEIKSKIGGNILSISWVYRGFSVLSLLAIGVFSNLYGIYFLALGVPFAMLYFMRSGYVNEKWV